MRTVTTKHAATRSRAESLCFGFLSLNENHVVHGFLTANIHMVPVVLPGLPKVPGCLYVIERP